MGTLYVMQDDAFIGKVDERLKITHEKQVLQDVPLIKLDGVVVMGRATVSPAALMELLERKIPLTFLHKTGRYLGSLEAPLGKNIFIRSAQWEAAKGDDAKRLHMVKAFVRGKLKNYRNLLLRAQRENTGVDFGRALGTIESAIDGLPKMDNVDGLRGLEGAGSAAYFGSFDRLLKNPDFTFKNRNRRPPLDPVNALLSFGYALLLHDVQSAVNIAGFDPYLGYLHVERYGRPSLALDLMEEFRPLVVDAIVLTAINRKLLSLADFTTEPVSGAVSLSDEGRKVFLRLYEQKKQSEFKHPVMEKKCTYQKAFLMQARLLGKYLMAETELYPPLVLK
jgi:CRISP-associated protein Cas1